MTPLSVWLKVNFYSIFMNDCSASLLQNDETFLLEITDGVAHLHDNMILHRDLKAENILLSGNSVRIGDFGGAGKFFYF